MLKRNFSDRLLGKKYIRSLALMVVALFLPILVSNAAFGDMSIRSPMWLGIGAITISTILICANLRLNSSKEAAEHLCGILLFIVMVSEDYLWFWHYLFIFPLQGLTALWSMLIVALLARGVSAVIDNLD